MPKTRTPQRFLKITTANAPVLAAFRLRSQYALAIVRNGSRFSVDLGGEHRAGLDSTLSAEKKSGG
jgi:hypothetical protein